DFTAPVMARLAAGSEAGVWAASETAKANTQAARRIASCIPYSVIYTNRPRKRCITRGLAFCRPRPTPRAARKTIIRQELSISNSGVEYRTLTGSLPWRKHWRVNESNHGATGVGMRNAALPGVQSQSGFQPRLEFLLL